MGGTRSKSAKGQTDHEKPQLIYKETYMGYPTIIQNVFLYSAILNIHAMIREKIAEAQMRSCFFYIDI
jgi:hypothetical protein